MSKQENKDEIDLVEKDIRILNDKGEKVVQTEWHRIAAWGKTAEIIEKYVTKGKEVSIEGKLTHRSYEDKNGEKRYITEVLANEILLIDKLIQ